MYKRVQKVLSVILCGAFVFSLSACTGTKNQNAEIEEIFTDMRKIAYSKDYTQLSATSKNSTEDWRQGMISGNGLQGFISSGSPYSDTLIFQNMHFIMPNENIRYCPDTADELETVKQSIAAGEDITDDASYDDVYRFHPGGELRIAQEKEKYSDYLRYTDYETAEVGVKYTDKYGTWKRTSFTSQEDSVTITKISKSSENAKVNLTLSFDDISVIANYGDSDETNIQYKKIVAEDLSYIAFLAHYPDYENSELSEGGYATLTYVIAENGTKEKVQGDSVKDTQYVGDGNPQIKISDADNVYLITVSDRTYDLGEMDEFKSQTDYAIIDSLAVLTKEVADKYSGDGGFDYDTALANHIAIWQPQYDAVEFTLEDSTAANETLIKAQKGDEKISSALAQRAYYAGRYAYLCASGYSTTRLYGMWVGEFNAGWGSKYTMDANVNLQTSSMNTGNIASSPIGYANFILRQADDWEANALATHGYTDAVQAPVHSDGDSAYLTETCYSYPFRYWNAGASWLLQPLYETLQCYGDMQIPLSDEFDLNNLKSVLSLTEEDLTDEDIAAIEEKGYLDLKSEILLPLLTKSANYWAQLMTAEYYTDADGEIHYEAGKTALAEDEYYAILPSYSPENNPSNYSSPSDANTAIDIAACRDNLKMLIDITEQVIPDADTSQWQELMDKLPVYLYDETGALKEWATTAFEENNEHRHLSHLYCVWPLFETQDNEELAEACMQAIENRESENEASHALVHRSLIAARLKDSDLLSEALLTLMNHKIYYDSLMTNHNFDRSSAYCTDFAIGYLGIINEALVYSNSGEIEILPALPTSGFASGSISGIRARTQAEITGLVWNTEAKTASVTIKSDIEQSIELSCGLSDETERVDFAAGEEKTVAFTFN